MALSADNPGSISQGPNRGWGFVLDQNIATAPLREWMRGDALAEAKKQRAEQEKKKKEAEFSKFLSDADHASLIYQDKSRQWFNTFADQMTNLQLQANAGKISPIQLQAEQAKLKYDLGAKVKATNQLADERNRFDVALKNPVYDADKLRTAANQLFLNEDGNLKDSPDPEFAIKAQSYLDDPQYLNKNVVTKKFFDSLQQTAYRLQQENGTITEETAIKNKLPLLFETDANGVKKPVLDAAGHYRIDINSTLPLIKTDPLLSKIIDKEYGQMRNQAIDEGLPEPTYQQAIEKHFADNNPVDFTYRRTLDEPWRPRESDERKKQKLEQLTPEITTRTSNLKKPVTTSSGQYTGQTTSAGEFTSSGYNIKSEKGSSILPFADLTGIPATGISFADGSKPVTNDVRTIDVRAYHVGQGLLSAGGTPIVGRTTDEVIDYIRTRLKTPEDFKKVRLGKWLEGEIVNKTNRQGETIEAIDQNKQNSRLERVSPHLDTEKRVFLPWSESISKGLKTLNPAADYDKLPETPDFKRIRDALTDQWKAVNGQKSTKLDPLSEVKKAGKVRLGRGALDDL